MDQKVKSRNGFGYRTTSNRYTDILRNREGRDCLSIDHNMDFERHRKRGCYEYKRSDIRMRKNEEIGIYDGNRNVIPEYEYETQYVASAEKQLDMNSIDGNVHLNKRYMGGYGGSSSSMLANSNETMNGYLGSIGHNAPHGRTSKNEYSHFNNSASSHYQHDYYNSSKRRRGGSDGGGILRNRGEYRSCDSRRSSTTVYNNHSDKKVRYSDDSVEYPEGNGLSRDYHNKINTNSEDIEHFQWYVGQYLTQRYRILDIIGEGTFGRVFECEDLKRKRRVAVKVIRDVQRYTSAAKIEAEILRDINMEDEFGEYSYCVMLYNAFLYNNSNMCLVFEKLGPSLYDFLDGNCSRGFFLADIQNIAEQFLLALSFLRRIRLTHTDLKLENILLTDNNYIWVNAPRHPGTLIRRPIRPEIRLIDFGAATYEHDYHGSVINTRQYRAPEVILDLGWDMSSDMWGFGCILMELYTGVLLFKTHEHMEHLAMIEKIVEPFPDYMLRRAYNSSKSGRKYVDRFRVNNTIDRYDPNEYGKGIHDGNNSTMREEFRYILNWPEGSSSTTSIRRVNDCRPLEGLVHKKHLMLAKFIRYILRPDPNLRPTPEMALRHEFFRYKFEEEI